MYVGRNANSCQFLVGNPVCQIVVIFLWYCWKRSRLPWFSPSPGDAKFISPCVGMFLCDWTVETNSRCNDNIVIIIILHEAAVGVYSLYVATWLAGSLFYLEVAVGVYSLYVATWLAGSLFYLNENNTNAMCVCWSTRLKSWSYW
jgi:hypothetical protein